MSLEGFATAVATALLGGGVATTIGAIVAARINARKAKPERDSIIVGGAEQAVATMGNALLAADRRIAALEADNLRLSSENRELRADVDRLHTQLDSLRYQLALLSNGREPGYDGAL